MEKRKCPIPNTHKRLNEVGFLIDQAAHEYHHPEKFIMNINQSVQALRNVTFILQSEKSNIPNFENWYSKWQFSFKNDPIMKWLIEARNKVVKQGDLEIASFAKATLRNWLDHVVFEAELSPVLSAVNLAHAVRELVSEDRGNKLGRFLINIERKWSVSEFPDKDILSLLTYGKEKLAQLVHEGHEDHESHKTCFACCEHYHPLSHLSLDISKITSATLNPNTGEIFKPVLKKIASNSIDGEQAVARYELDKCTVFDDQDNFFQKANKMTEIAKKILVRDRKHIAMVFLITPNDEWKQILPEFKNQEEKYAFFYQLAQIVSDVGATGIICINEAWARFIENSDKKLSELQKKEVLSIVAANANEGIRSWSILFRRGIFGSIILEETEIETDPKGWMFLNPILKVWGIK